MILADTSAWVEYDRATGSAVHRRVAELFASEGLLSVTEPVVMEVLVGARSDERELDLRRLLLHFRLLRFDAAADFDAAARIYRRCRAVGFIPRGMVDCMIATVAWRDGLRWAHRMRTCSAKGKSLVSNWTRRRRRPERA
jgi:predicted nucleic acid-binding protein